MDDRIDYDRSSIRSKFDFWNTLNREKTDSFRGKRGDRKRHDGLDGLRRGRVKQMVADIEKLSENVDAAAKTGDSDGQNTKEFATIVDQLLEFQIRMRSDLRHINWPTVIMASTTKNGIMYSNVNIEDDDD